MQAVECLGVLEGARASRGASGLRELVEPSVQIAERFAALQTLLDAQRQGDGFKLYNELSQDEIKQLSDAVNALSEPLSQLAAAVV